MRHVLPVGVSGLLEALETAGFAAYAVGGCVRTAFWAESPGLGHRHLCPPGGGAGPVPHAIPTGIAHGTVTVVWEGPLEVTTFRAESAYTDHRHPDQVRFVPDLEADLARRDFTVNAMACRQDGQVIDQFGSREDLKMGSSAVWGTQGNSSRRTPSGSCGRCGSPPAMGFGWRKKLLPRCWNPGTPLLCGGGTDLGRVFTPSLRHRRRSGAEGVPSGDFLQFCQSFSQWRGFFAVQPSPRPGCVGAHLCRSGGIPLPELAVRLAMLLHDCGKPGCFTLDGEEQDTSMATLKKLGTGWDGAEAVAGSPFIGERVLLLIHLHDR